MPKLNQLFTISCLIFFFGITNDIYGQKKLPQLRLLYLADEGKEGKDYLVPLISDMLNNLPYSEDNGVKVFKEVNSLNVILQKNQVQTTIISKYIASGEQQNAKTLGKDSVIDAENKKTIQTLEQHDNVLTIKINTFNDLIEIQFTRYKIERNADPKLTRILKYDRSSSNFVNPNEANYKVKIEHALKQVFPEASYAPRIRTLINGNPTRTANYIARGDVFELSVDVFDQDSPVEDHSFIWQEIVNSLPIQVGVATQEFSNLPTGVYMIGVKVSDGIALSSNERILFEIYEKPYVPLQISENTYFNTNLVLRDNWFGRPSLVDKPKFFVDQPVTGFNKDFQLVKYEFRLENSSQKSVYTLTHDFLTSERLLKFDRKFVREIDSLWQQPSGRDYENAMRDFKGEQYYSWQLKLDSVYMADIYRSRIKLTKLLSVQPKIEIAFGTVAQKQLAEPLASANIAIGVDVSLINNFEWEVMYHKFLSNQQNFVMTTSLMLSAKFLKTKRVTPLFGLSYLYLPKEEASGRWIPGAKVSFRKYIKQNSFDFGGEIYFTKPNVIQIYLATNLNILERHSRSSK